MNIGRSIEAPRFAPLIDFTFTDAYPYPSDELHRITVHARVAEDWAVPESTRLQYRATLLAPKDGRPMGVVGVPITLIDAAGTATDRWLWARGGLT